MEISNLRTATTPNPPLRSRNELAHHSRKQFERAQYSVTEALLKNGHRGLVYGVGIFEEDRVHLNDAHPITVDASYADVGDIMLSSRHLSMVALFRPQNGSIVWLKTGPWVTQHDIDDLGDGTFSVFGNDYVRGPNAFLNGGFSEVYIYEPATGRVQTPYSSVLERASVWTPSGGRARILDNGDAFIEESDRLRLLRISRSGVRWEYVNGVTDKTTGSLNWCRYLRNDDVDIQWLEDV